MAVVHNTTMTPGKLELLASWLPSQPWYVGTGREPDLSRAGGFRLDDPQGEVGIEFMVVTDRSGDRPVSYHVPLSYRGAPLDGADEGLIGTSEHEVLGRRWVYDGTHDPVVVAQLLALFQGRAEPQAQNATDTRDASVTAHFTGTAFPTEAGPTAVVNGPDGTHLVLAPEPGADPDTTPPVLPTLRLTRVLAADHRPPAQAPAEPHGHLTAPWRLPDGTETRALFATLHPPTP
ncbi:1,4-alpha-glucan branching protein [Streptomyces sp. NPDC002018]|uniref:maltokinase N-terminal cap-like domain-containing protein n=1 Tax=Streptomyces sp. NPDC002018 TaxID=3364629 RepID=UPI003689292E